MKKIFLFLNMLGLLWSCNNMTMYVENDVCRDNLKGHVKEVVCEGYVIKGECNGDYILEQTDNCYDNGPWPSKGSGLIIDMYNEDGYKVNHAILGISPQRLDTIYWEMYFCNYEEHAKWPYEKHVFNMKGDEECIILGEKDQNNEYTIEYEYNPNNELTGHYYHYFDQDGNCTFTSYVAIDNQRPKYKISYEYDEYGRFCYCHDEIQPYAFEITYNKKGIRTEFHILQYGEVYQVYKANKNGDWIEYLDGTIKYLKYDKKKNWIERVIFDEYGSASIYEKRSINYYD